MNKKTFPYLVFLCLLLSIPAISLAGDYVLNGHDVHFEGLVPCGKSEASEGESDEVTNPCQLCHIFVMLSEILRFGVTYIIPPVAVLLVIWGGVQIFLAGFNPASFKKGLETIKVVAIGIAIILGSWIIVNTLFMFIGVADWTGLREGWFRIDCGEFGMGEPPPTNEICNNGVDDDEDGRVDCADTADCCSNAACIGNPNCCEQTCDGCAIGSTLCQQEDLTNGIATCVMIGGCAYWSNFTGCANNICVSNGCNDYCSGAAPCVDECSDNGASCGEGDTMCMSGSHGASYFVTCGHYDDDNYNGDTCLEWNTIPSQFCAPNPCIGTPCHGYCQGGPIPF